MSYTVKYTGSKQEKYNAAFKDSIDWLSQGQVTALKQLAADLKTNNMRRVQRFNSLLLALSFTGINGFPARVMAFYFIYGCLPK